MRQLTTVWERGCVVGIHDDYGKRVLSEVAGAAYTVTVPSVRVDYGAGGYANIDGTVGDQIAVEVESRVSKQLRGALMDLIFHSYPKKLLVSLPVHMNDPKKTVAQCERILARFLDKSNFRVILLKGHGSDQCVRIDTQIVKHALNELGFGG